VNAPNHRVWYRSAAVVLLVSVALTLLDVDAVIPLLVTAVAIVLMTVGLMAQQRGPMIIAAGPTPALPLSREATTLCHGSNVVQFRADLGRSERT
jgi:hypothetical protein